MAFLLFPVGIISSLYIANETNDMLESISTFNYTKCAKNQIDKIKISTLQIKLSISIKHKEHIANNLKKDINNTDVREQFRILRKECDDIQKEINTIRQEINSE